MNGNGGMCEFNGITAERVDDDTAIHRRLD